MRPLTNPSLVTEKLQRMGKISGAARRGDSAWGYRMQALKMNKARWKPWNKALYESTFPFTAKPEYRD